jgi:hypothetical protein
VHSSAPEDGAQDSICLTYLATIATLNKRGDLAREEEKHVCKFLSLSADAAFFPAKLCLKVRLEPRFGGPCLPKRSCFRAEFENVS